MLIIGLCPANIKSALDGFNSTHRATVEANGLQDKSSRCRVATRCTFAPAKASDKYGRRGNSGQRVKALCWHGHRDLFRYLFAAYDPENAGTIEIRTALATYRGKSDFESSYQATDRNVGSLAKPLRYSTACDCDKGEHR